MTATNHTNRDTDRSCAEALSASVQRYRAVELLVALYGCKNWSVALRMLREIFGTKREEVRGDWRKLHNEEL